MKWEKELNSKLESADTARLTVDNSDCRIEELELQLQKCTVEKNDIEIEMEEAIQDTGLITCLLLSIKKRQTCDIIVFNDVTCFREKRYKF